MNRWTFVRLAIAGLSLGISLWVWFYGYDRLPEQVPTHWDIKMEVDQFTPREQMLPQLLLFPGMLLGWVFLAAALPWLSPRPFGMTQWRPTYEYVTAIAAGLLVYMQCILLAMWMDLGLDFMKWFPGGMFLFFAALGNTLGKVRRNFYVGVRTPWTIASVVVWDRTHRLAAWLFTAGGLAGSRSFWSA